MATFFGWAERPLTADERSEYVQHSKERPEDNLCARSPLETCKTDGVIDPEKARRDAGAVVKVLCCMKWKVKLPRPLPPAQPR